MLRFAVYDDTGPATEWPLVNAHLLGPDDLALRSSIAFKDGCVCCKKRAGHTVALCLQYETPSIGRLMLQTCLLPERDQPYVLSLELARHRIKMFIAKSEEWQMFDLSAEHPAMRKWETARQIFTEALNLTDPLEADRAGRRSLEHALEATERLALAHAEILLHRRYATRPASSTTLGVRVHPGRDARKLRDLIASDLDVLVLPLTWRELEVEEGKYHWEPLDRWMEWAQTQGKPVLAGPLLDFSKAALPEWMYVWQHDYDTCRDLAYDHIQRVVERYGSCVGIWNIAAGLNVNDNFEFTAAQMMDLTRMASLLVKQTRKQARTMLECVQPFGEHLASSRDSVPPFTYIDRVVQEGIKVDCVGVQLVFGEAEHGRAARDLAQISSMLDRFFLLELPVLISAAGVPAEVVDEDAGWWRERWTPERQSTWLTRLFAVALSKPYIESFVVSELFDHGTAVPPKSGLIDEAGKPRLALQKLVRLRKQMRKPLGPLKLPPRRKTQEAGR